MKKKNKSKGKPNVRRKNTSEKLKIAMKNSFFLEASWLISSLLEKRLKNILRKVEKPDSVIANLFDQNIKRIKHLCLNTDNPLLKESFNVQMMDGLRTWKNQRNEVMKDMLVRHISENRLERLANDGVRILKEWNTMYKAFKRNAESK